MESILETYMVSPQILENVIASETQHGLKKESAKTK